jgi:hypothetical protein
LPGNICLMGDVHERKVVAARKLRQNLADPFLGLLKGLPSGEEAREIRRLRPPAIGLVVVDPASARGDEKAELQPDCNRRGWRLRRAADLGNHSDLTQSGGDPLGFL